MTCGDARQLVPYVMDLYSQTKCEQKITTSNGGESTWVEKQQYLPHPMAISSAERADWLEWRVG
jgi:hypothetical protein